MSKSVAVSILFCKTTLKLKQFAHCDGTVSFLEMFNDLFDIPNSRSIRDHGYKQSFRADNVEKVFKKFNTSKLSILSMKNAAETYLLNTKKFTSFLGFLINIESAVALYKYL